MNYYDEHGDEFFADTVDLVFTDLYMPFLDLLPKGSRILDAGCGSGRDSRYFIDNGYDVTSMDASEKMVALSSEFLNRQVLHLSFQEIDFKEEFDGIWACSSLLHINRKEIDNVLRRLTDALVGSGVIYASFKHGNKEEKRKGLLFNYYDEASFESLISGHSQLGLIETWRTNDLRKGREHELWFNILLRKQ